jgi:acetoin utilization deacetylase AcuC-like enzyme
MTTLVLTHPAGLGHDPGPGHPEAPARLEAALGALDGLAGVVVAEAPEAALEALTRVHRPDMIEAMFDAIPATGYGMLDRDTIVSPGSRAAALRAAGAGVAAVDAVLGGVAANAFCAIRPPGHHATRDRAMGFCLFNNAAIAAFHARAVHGVERVAVVDFDVHHGNGTEDIFRGRAGLFYGSSHEYPNYPGTGRASEDGPCPIVNAPLPAMSAGEAFRAAWSDLILPELAAFKPELLIVSAGFDGHRRDPLSTWQLEVADFAWLTRELRRRAEADCGGRLVSFLEGGYDLDALAACVRAHAAALAA